MSRGRCRGVPAPLESHTLTEAQHGVLIALNAPLEIHGQMTLDKEQPLLDLLADRHRPVDAGLRAPKTDLTLQR